MKKDGFTIALVSEGDQWIAQMLEHDVCAQGPSVVDALNRLAMTLYAESWIGEGWEAHKPPPADWRKSA